MGKTKILINETAPVKTSQEIEIDATIEKVWGIQTAINHWPNWHPTISKAELNGNLEEKSTFLWIADGFRLNSTIQRLSENKVIAWTGKGFGASAIHIWEFEALENGKTLVRTKESMEGWLVNLLKGMMMKKLDESLQLWLNALKEEAERDLVH